MGFPTIPDSKILQMVKLFNQGLTIIEIARKLKVDKGSVHKYLGKLEVKRVDPAVSAYSGKRLTEEQKEQILTLYREDVVIKDIMEIVGCSKPTVYEHVNAAGLTRRPSKERLDKAYKLYLENEKTVEEIIKETGMSRRTFYKHRQKYISDSQPSEV